MASSCLSGKWGGIVADWKEGALPPIEGGGAAVNGGNEGDTVGEEATGVDAAIGNTAVAAT